MSTTAVPSPSQTTAQPSSSPTNPPQPSGPQNSPLLFFVALGFGVVFTNLWIIVGVKYCFRYNARNRARQQGEDGEPIDLVNMQQHRRRRREKKLMTLDEINERFPILKYKTWVSRRAAEGMPTEGGVSQNRAASIRDAEGVIEPIGESSKSIVNADVASTTEVQPSSTAAKDAAGAETSRTSAAEKAVEDSTSRPATNDQNAMATTTQEIAATGGHDHAHDHDHDHDDEEDGIAPAVPGAAEMLESPGDCCAICIDTLEENDDVRGLSCGHAFHGSCIDPWLTNRRACCPLCKADYYVPKARPEQAGADGANPEQAGAQASDSTQNPQDQGPPAHSPGMIVGRFMPSRVIRSQAPANPGPNVQAPAPTLGNRFTSVFRRGASDARTEEQQTASAAPTAAAAPATQPSEGRRWVPSLPSWRRGRAQGDEQATPSQLEAGNTNTNT